MSGKTNGVSLLVSDNHITINADVEFAIEERGDIPAAHISDVVYQLILDGLRKHEKAALGPGSYKAMLTFVASGIPQQEAVEDETVEDQAGGLVDEMLADVVPDTEDK
jgi:hypothetical protein